MGKKPLRCGGQLDCAATELTMGLRPTGASDPKSRRRPGVPLSRPSPRTMLLGRWCIQSEAPKCKHAPSPEAKAKSTTKRVQGPAGPSPERQQARHRRAVRLLGVYVDCTMEMSATNVAAKSPRAGQQSCDPLRCGLAIFQRRTPLKDQHTQVAPSNRTTRPHHDGGDGRALLAWQLAHQVLLSACLQSLATTSARCHQSINAARPDLRVLRPPPRPTQSSPTERAVMPSRK